MPKGQQSTRITNNKFDTTRTISLACGKEYRSQNIRMVSKVAELHKRQCTVCRGAGSQTKKILST